MSSLSRLANSFISATNENTLALANFNFDFSLVKLEAPQEFVPLGSALSTDRRSNAEGGALHQLARKVGALFEQVIPSTPKLLKAYGCRASEIVEAPGINPKRSRDDGPFESFVGVDGTSVWAAATSGPASIGVLLLACMLARMFDDAKVSTAVWVELVHERQKEVERSVGSGEVVSASSVMAARQTISREQLALFDAGARAWLNSADEAKMSEQKRLMLILKNIPAWVSTGTSTYSKVIDAWTKAMKGLEDLLNGMPQEILEGAILLALSAWHLYPDLVVLANETKKVTFSDTLFPKTGIVTLGIQPIETAAEQGIRWSLTLSHLRYYGDPIRVDSRADNSRVNVRQLCMVALGAFLATWNVLPKAMLDAAAWLDVLWRSLSTRHSSSAIAFAFPWLDVVCTAASQLTQAQGEELEDNQMLLAFGFRRREVFLGKSEQGTLPFFGLLNPFVLHSLTAASVTECGVLYLRYVAESLKLQEREAVIVYVEYLDKDPYLVFVTAVPSEERLLKRTQNGSQKSLHRHARWIYKPVGSLPSAPGDIFAFGNALDPGALEARRSEGVIDIPPDKEDAQRQRMQKWKTRISEKLVASRCEEDVFVPAEVKLEFFQNETLIWHEAPRQFSDLSSTDADADADSQTILTAPRFIRFLGHQGYMSLFIASQAAKNRASTYKTFNDIRQSALPLEQSAAMLQRSAVNPTLLVHYLMSVSDMAARRTRIPDGASDEEHRAIWILAAPRIHANTLISLEALAIASHVYKQFPSATVSLRITSQPLYKAECLPRITPGGLALLNKGENAMNIGQFITRAEAFSLIAMFESGGLSIDPKHLTRVMAISASNSIFVAACVLSDPEENLPASSIKRIVGNIGSAGISLLVAPENPRMRTESNDYRAVLHVDYDRQRVDSFRGTTLHLSFTGWKVPLTSGAQGFIDQDIHFLEAIISMRDRGTWVADLDVLQSLNDNLVKSADGMKCNCKPPNQDLEGEFTSIDNWDELIDPPQSAAVVRAHGNWAARVAAICIVRTKFPSRQLIVVPKQVGCWSCLGTGQKGVCSSSISSFLID
jgi:hypothetical protein